MGIYFDTFKILKETQQVVDLYRDLVTDESLTGIVTDYSESLVYLSLLNDVGLPNGIAIVFVDDVTRVRWGGNARLSIKQLADASGTVPQRPSLSLDSLLDAIKSVQKVFGYVNVLTERMDDGITFIGEVEAIDENALVLNGYGTMLTRDRSHLLLKLECITRIDAGAPYEQSIQFLFQQKI